MVELAKLLAGVRSFFADKNFLELETPLLIPHPNAEAFIDSLQVKRDTVNKQLDWQQKKDKFPPTQYLISSPEFPIKQILLQLKPLSQAGVFQIAHCFRSGERGRLHREEFLMLECYLLGADEMQFMKFFSEFLQQMIRLFSKQIVKRKQSTGKQRKLADIFHEYTGSNWQKLRKDSSTFLEFEERFQKCMIEKIEDHLGWPDPEFIYHFPAEMAGFGKITSSNETSQSYAHRFELYWQGIELANGYRELTTYEEYLCRLNSENRIRKSLGKQRIDLPIPLLHALQKQGPLPESCGIALGLDRFLMLLQNQKSLCEL